MRINVSLNFCTTSALVLVCYQVLLNANQRVAQLLHLFWCSARLFQVLLNENQLVVQLLHLFCCAARLFQVFLNEKQRVAQLLPDCFKSCLRRINV